MSSKDHIKALADRFMKEGAEDLWNEDDGPIRSKSESEKSMPPPLDLKKIVKEGRNSVGKLGSFGHRREYSTWRRNLSSSDDEDGDVDGGRGGGLIRNKLKISRFISGKGEEEIEKEERGVEIARTTKMSWAALRNHDAKKKRRAPRGDEEGDDFSEQIQKFRDEIRNRDSGRNELKGYEVKQDSVLTQRR